MLKNWLIRMHVMEYLHHVQFYLDLRYRKTVIYIYMFAIDMLYRLQSNTS